MAKEDKHFSDLLIEMSKTVTLKGIRETIKDLKKQRVSTATDEKIKTIKDAIIYAFNDKECLVSKSNDVNMAARAIMAYMLRFENVPYNTIAMSLNVTTKQSVYNMVKYFKNANLFNPKVPSDIILKEGYEKAKQKLNDKNYGIK